MSITTRTARRTVTAVALAAAALGAAAGTASASPAATPAGYITQVSCASVSGSTVYSPGLKINTPRATTAVTTASTAGCQDIYGDDLSGAGSLNLTLSGTSSYGHVNESGSFVISWPRTFNPSTGSMTLTGPAPDGSYGLAGSVSGGAFVGAYVSTRLFITGTNAGATGRVGHLLNRQSFVNTTPLTLSRSSG